MALSKMNSLIPDQVYDSLIPAVREHKILVTGTILLSPLVYYSIKFWLWLRKSQKKWKILTDNFKGPEKHWLYGNLHQHPGAGADGLAFHEMLTAQYSPSGFVIWFGSTNPALNIVHPQAAKETIAGTISKPVGFMGNYRFAKPWIGDGLLISSGDKWFRNRRLLTPAFHFDVLKPYMDVYNEAVGVFLEKLRASNGEYIELFSQVGLMTLDIIMQCAFSFKDKIQQRGDSHPYVTAVRRLGDLLVYRAFHPYLLPDSLFYASSHGREFARHAKYAHKISRDVIDKRRKALKENPALLELGNDGDKKKYRDFLDILLLARDSDGTGLTDAEIRDEVDTFMFEGHDTTASAISWILYTLACHPEAQEKARKEVDELLAGRDKPHLTWEDMKELPYLTCCIKEAIRIHSPVPFIGRTTTKDIEVDGKTVPAGINIDIVIYDIHHNPHVWGEDHNVFRPERFDPDNMKDMDPYAFIPFSAGPRNCIGQNFAMHEIKVAVARTLREFELESDPERPALHYAVLVMRAEHGMYLKFKPRTAAS